MIFEKQWIVPTLKHSTKLHQQAGDYGQAAQRLAQAPSLLLLDASASNPSDPDTAAAATLQATAQAYASLLAEWSARGYRGEADMFLARAVLHALARVPGPPLDPAATDAAVAFCKALLLAAAAAGEGEEGEGGMAAVVGKGSPLLHFVGVLVALIEVGGGASVSSFYLSLDNMLLSDRVDGGVMYINTYIRTRSFLHACTYTTSSTASRGRRRRSSCWRIGTSPPSNGTLTGLVSGGGGGGEWFLCGWDLDRMTRARVCVCVGF